jgi:hypothetical protein
MSALPKTIVELATAAIQFSTAMASMVTLILAHRVGKVRNHRSTAPKRRRKNAP